MLVAAVQPACAADVSPYFDSAAGRKPRSNAGVVVSGDRVQLQADVAVRAGGGSTEVVPNLHSVFDVSDRLDVETKVELADRNSSGSSSIVNTHLHYDPPPKFIEAVDGTVWRSPDGQAGEALNIAFRKIIGAGERQRPITIRGRAGLESTSADPDSDAAADAPFGAGSYRYGLETEVRGLLGGLVLGGGALRLKIDRFAGAHVETVKSLAYSYSWTLRNVVQLGLNIGMRHDAQPAIVVSEPSVGLTWRAQF